MLVIPSEARNLARPQKQSKIPRFAQNDTAWNDAVVFMLSGEPKAHDIHAQNDKRRAQDDSLHPICYPKNVLNILKSSHKATLLGLLALLLAAVIGLQWTNDSGQLASLFRSRRAQRAEDDQLVDQRPLETAHTLAAEAATRSERKVAAEALLAADHEVDLAFASALEAAQRSPQAQSAAAKAAAARIQRLEARVADGQSKVQQLTAKAAAAKGGEQDRYQKQLELAQAGLALDQDGLADAKEDLARAGGDTYARIQRLLKEHQAAEHATGNAQTAPAAPSPGPPGALIPRWSTWRLLSSEQAELIQAQQDAAQQAAALSRTHDALKSRLQSAQAQRRSQAEQAASLLESKQKAGPDSAEIAKAAVESLHSLSSDQKELASLDERIQDLQRLSTIYGEWNTLVSARARAYLHRVILSLFWIVVVLLAVFLVARLFDHLFDRLTSDLRQLLTLRAVARFAIQTVGLLMILFLILGIPNQLSTILGLAGAGLTVALQDFIIAFLGWFVLMGRHGIRVGDWVEIDGVSGEVIEIGLLRTLLLEVGNWNDSGHPTGRQVAFLNKFAVSGHYFNFSTSGQWLWDQLQVSIPPGEDPYPALEKIQAAVEKETADDFKQAEQEWQRVTRHCGVKQFSAAPALHMKPSGQGVEVVIHYITRAKERSQVRSRLNHALAQLLSQKAPAPSLST